MEIETRIALIKQVDQLVPSEELLKKYLKMATDMVAAGMLPPGYKTGQDVLVVALNGREVGLDFYRSIKGLYPMNGRIGYMGTLILGMIAERMPDAEVSITEQTKEKCTIQIHRPNWKPERFEEVTVTWEDAVTNKWHQSYNKDEKKGPVGWKDKPTWADRKNMLMWRCVAKVGRLFFEDVLGGAVYTPDELEDPGVVAENDPPVAKVEKPFKTAAQAAREAEVAKKKDEATEAEVVDPPPSATLADPPPAEQPPVEQTEVPGTPSPRDPNVKDDDLLLGFFNAAKSAPTLKALNDVYDLYFAKANPATKTELFKLRIARKTEIVSKL